MGQLIRGYYRQRTGKTNEAQVLKVMLVQGMGGER